MKPKLLLHICCIGCGAYISELLKKDYNLLLYFFNPNIFPPSEYERRLRETKKIAKNFGLPLIEGVYDHKKWLLATRGLEKEPEGGARCAVCYRYRLEEAACLAKREKYDFLAATLTISPHKDSRTINQIGREIGERYNNIKFLEKDFKKDDGFRKSCQLSRELGLYRQNYCGCEFSISTNQQIFFTNLQI